MILVGDRGSKQGENLVSGGLHNIAVIPMDGVDHELQRWVDDRPRLLRIEIRHEFGRALDVSKQGRDRLTLAVGNVVRID
jgi:hypothetical protein